MNSSQRRDKITEMLGSASQPLSAAAIAQALNVSRQIIVGDIALLRASGCEICATPRGYVLGGSSGKSGEFVRTIACKHDNSNLADEIYTIIDNGGAMLDVIVEHSIYGQLTGKLHLFSRYDADQFIEKISKQNTSPLSALTDGIHLHTISCKNEEAFNRIISKLDEKGILLKI